MLKLLADSWRTHFGLSTLLSAHVVIHAAVLPIFIEM